MTTATRTTTPATLAARAEASVWITQLHGPDRSPQMEEGFRRWLGERPENAVEFEGLTEVWELVAGGAAVRGVARIERWEHSQEAKELKALREHQANRSSMRRHRAIRPWSRAAIAILAVGILATSGIRLWRAPSYATDLGEQRTVQLEDGSRVSLNSSSRVEVVYDGSFRRIRLEQGEAFFEVTPDATRPFVVTVGASRVTALGTSFAVRYEPESTAVTLVEGKVQVANDAAMSDFTLLPGQRLTLARSQMPTVDLPRLETITAWRRGEVVLNDTPLAAAVAEMNRYNRKPIVIESPEISSLEVSGLYHTGDSEGFARSVAVMHGLQVSERDRKIYLHR